MWYAIVAILILIADQGLKYWVTVNIPLDTGHVTLIPGVLELTNIHNNGAAFSMLEHAPHWIFIIFTLVFAAIAVFCLRRNVVHGKVGRWSVVLVLAGAVGNCIDRILSGYVVDMFNFLFVRFAVFNLADVFIVVAGIALCLHVIFYRGDGSEDAPAPKKARKPRKRADASARAHKLHLPVRQKQVLFAQQILHGTAQLLKLRLGRRLAGNEHIQPRLHIGQQRHACGAQTALDAVALHGAAELFAHREAHLERWAAHIEQHHFPRSGGRTPAIDIFELRVLFQAVSSLQINNALLG